MSHRLTHTIVLAHSARTNSLGRAISMAMTASTVGPTEVWAVADGDTWVGAGQFPRVEIRLINLRKPEDFLARYRELAFDRSMVLWTCKGIEPLAALVQMLGNQHRATVLADFDDHDVDIMRSFKRTGFLNRLRANPLRRISPQRIARSQRQLASRADALTFSSASLRQEMKHLQAEDLHKEHAIVPHCREDSALPARSSANEGGPRFGFLGTNRAHKGLDSLVCMMQRLPSARMVTFKQEGVVPPRDLENRWEEIEPSTPLREAYGKIDYLLLPSNRADPATRTQLPAKYVDAANHGCVVLSTPGTPIDSFSPDAYCQIPDWSNVADIEQQLASLDYATYSGRIRESFLEHFSVESTGANYSALLGRVGTSR